VEINNDLTEYFYFI